MINTNQNMTIIDYFEHRKSAKYVNFIRVSGIIYALFSNMADWWSWKSSIVILKVIILSMNGHLTRSDLCPWLQRAPQCSFADRFKCQPCLGHMHSDTDTSYTRSSHIQTHTHTHSHSSVWQEVWLASTGCASLPLCSGVPVVPPPHCCECHHLVSHVDIIISP